MLWTCDRKNLSPCLFFHMTGLPGTTTMGACKGTSVHALQGHNNRDWEGVSRGKSRSKFFRHKRHSGSQAHNCRVASGATRETGGSEHGPRATMGKPFHHQQLDRGGKRRGTHHHRASNNHNRKQTEESGNENATKQTPEHTAEENDKGGGGKGSGREL